MAKTNTVPFTQTLKHGSNTIVAADTTAAKTVFTAGSEGSVVKALQAVSDDTSARVLNVYVNTGAGDLYLGSVNVPTLSGTNGLSTAPAVDLLSGTLMPGLPYDANGKRVLPLPAGALLKVSSQTTVTSAKTVTVTALAEDY